MATRRKVRDEQEARDLLDELRGSGLGMVEFCARAGVDGRSLNCWRFNLERKGAGDVGVTPPYPLTGHSRRLTGRSLPSSSALTYVIRNCPGGTGSNRPASTA